MQISAEPALTGLPRASSPIGFDGMVLRRLPSISSSGRPAASTSFTYPKTRFSSPPLEGAQHSHVGLRQAGPASHGVGVTVAEGAVPSPCGLNALANGAPQNNRASTPSDSTGDVQIEDQFSDEHARGQAESWSNSLLAQSLSNGNKAFDTLSALSSPIPGSAIKAHPAWKWPGANSQALQTQCPWPGAWAVPVATSPPPSGAAANPTTPGTVTSRASYLTQEQLLPSLLLSNDEPSLHLQQPTATSAATWPINPNPPMRMNSGKLKLPSGLPPLAAAVAAAERDGLQSQGQNLMAAAGAAVRELRAAGNGQQQQTHQVAGIQMLSSLLENLPPEELEALANLDTSQFDQLMLTAASKLTKAWDTPSSTSSHLTSPTTNPLSTPPAVMRTAPLAGTKLQSSNNGTYPDPHNMHSLFQQMQGMQMGATDAATSSPAQLVMPPSGEQQLHALLASPDLLLHPTAHHQWQQMLGSSPSPATGAVPLPALDLLGLRPAVQQDDSAQPVGEVGWDKLTQAVRERVNSMVLRCKPHIQISHFDGGVRHWLLQLIVLFGEDAALSGLSTIETATNLAGVRNMRAFVTTRLIDCFEQQIFRKDPHDYIAKRLSTEQYEMVHGLVTAGQGLEWSHFDPKVLDTIRNLGSLEYTRARLSRLSARDLASVQNVPAYIYTLLTKRGKTAKQAAAMKSASDAALNVLLEAASSPSSTPSPFSTLRSPSSGLHIPWLSVAEPVASNHTQLMLQRARTLGGPTTGSSFAYGTNNGTLALPAFENHGINRGTPAPQLLMPPMRSMSAQYDPAVAGMQQQYQLAALALMQQQHQQQVQQQQLWQQRWQ